MIILGLYLGIDGGGTKTKVALMNENDKIVYTCVSGPSSIDTVDLKTTKQAFIDALKPYLIHIQMINKCCFRWIRWHCF